MQWKADHGNPQSYTVTHWAFLSVTIIPEQICSKQTAGALLSLSWNSLSIEASHLKIPGVHISDVFNALEGHELLVGNLRLYIPLVDVESQIQGGGECFLNYFK